jgi:hypothetical protein
LGCLPYTCRRLRAFPQVPKGETLLNEREEEREREREREKESESA